jgi:hypothetical protein
MSQPNSPPVKSTNPSYVTYNPSVSGSIVEFQCPLGSAPHQINYGMDPKQWPGAFANVGCFPVSAMKPEVPTNDPPLNGVAPVTAVLQDSFGCGFNVPTLTYSTYGPYYFATGYCASGAPPPPAASSSHY